VWALGRLWGDEGAMSSVTGPVVVVVFFVLIATVIGLAALGVGHVEATWGAETVAAELAQGTTPPQGFTFGVLRDVTWSTTAVGGGAGDNPGASGVVILHADLGGLVPVTSAVALTPPSQLGGGA